MTRRGRADGTRPRGLVLLEAEARLRDGPGSLLRKRREAAVSSSRRGLRSPEHAQRRAGLAQALAELPHAGVPQPVAAQLQLQEPRVPGQHGAEVLAAGGREAAGLRPVGDAQRWATPPGLGSRPHPAPRAGRQRLPTSRAPHLQAALAPTSPSGAAVRAPGPQPWCCPHRAPPLGGLRPALTTGTPGGSRAPAGSRTAAGRPRPRPRCRPR